MPRVILRPDQFKRLLRRRRAMGGDRYDEVWNGVYVMSPEADNTHQRLARWLSNAIDHALGDRDEIDIFAGCNVSDDAEKWTRNYRVPDVAVFLPGNPAQDHETHWLGGPDFAVEILSPGDYSRKKFGFYAKVGVRELMLINRRPWTLELYRYDGASWHAVGKATSQGAQPLTSDLLGISFRLVPGPNRPRIEVMRIADGQRWLA
jgi:Uma2 family endonuclease